MKNKGGFNTSIVTGYLFSNDTDTFQVKSWKVSLQVTSLQNHPLKLVPWVVYCKR